MKDPIEEITANALTAAGVAFEFPENELDFYLPEIGIYIEVKQFHSSRIAEQMSRAPNVIAIQGREAALAFAALINKG